MPQRHGRFALFHRGGEESPLRAYRPLALLPSCLTRTRTFRRTLTRLLARSHGWSGAFEIGNLPPAHLHRFDHSEKRDLYETGRGDGEPPTILDYLHERGVRFHVCTSRGAAEPDLRSLERSLEEGEVEFAFVRYAPLAEAIEAYGTGSPEVTETVRRCEEAIRRLLASARKGYERVDLFVFSDRGAVEITDTCDVMARVASLDLRFGRHYTAFYEPTLARFWFHEPGAREAIEEALRAEGRGRILTEEDLERYGCRFAEARYGELLYLMNPGVLLHPNFVGSPRRPPAAVAGFAPEHEHSLAMFAANTVPEPLPRRIDDLFDLMRLSAGRAPEGGEGGGVDPTLLARA
jgi:hypothetical protein